MRVEPSEVGDHRAARLFAMKLLPRVLLILGGVALVGAIGVLSYGGLETWKQYIALSANRSMAFLNPVGYMIGGAALALLAGLLGGYALGVPRNPKQPPQVTPGPPQTADPTIQR